MSHTSRRLKEDVLGTGLSSARQQLGKIISSVQQHNRQGAARQENSRASLAADEIAAFIDEKVQEVIQPVIVPRSSTAKKY